jgi:hypothetical protein
VEGKWKRGCRDIFDSREKNRCQRGEGWWPNDEEWGALVKPALVEVNSGKGENKVAQPIGQAQKVGLVGTCWGRNHQVISGGGSAGWLALLTARSLGKHDGLSYVRIQIRLQRRGDLLHNQSC